MLRPMRLFVGLSLLWSCAACGAAGTAAASGSDAPVTRPVATPARSAGAPTVEPTHDSQAPLARRVFNGSERFGDLVAGAQALASAGAGDSDKGCLFARDADAFRLEADLLPAVRPLPDPPVDLATGLARTHGRVRTLSHWGQSGTGEYELALVGLTTTPASAARAPATAILLTRKGVFLRHAERDAVPEDGPLPLAGVGARLAGLSGHALYVTAERDVSIAEIHALLAQLPFDRPVALAVALAPGTRIPEEPKPALAPEWSCPRGLPRPAKRSRPGEIGQSALAAALAPLRDEGARCLSTATGPALAGGKLTLALRVDEGGRVGHVCAIESTLADAALTRCVLESARMLVFPVPSPAGSVDLHLPLELSPLGFATQRPVCF